MFCVLCICTYFYSWDHDGTLVLSDSVMTKPSSFAMSHKARLAADSLGMRHEERSLSRVSHPWGISGTGALVISQISLQKLMGLYWLHTVSSASKRGLMLPRSLQRQVPKPRLHLYLLNPTLVLQMLAKLFWDGCLTILQAACLASQNDFSNASTQCVLKII